MSRSEERRTVKLKVQRILERYPETRGDDNILVSTYWRVYDGVDVVVGTGDFINDATKPETITRARREIQSAGLYLPDDATVLRRRKREIETRAHYAAQAN